MVEPIIQFVMSADNAYIADPAIRLNVGPLSRSFGGHSVAVLEASGVVTHRHGVYFTLFINPDSKFAYLFKNMFICELNYNHKIILCK